jgi:hypothetical protein
LECEPGQCCAFVTTSGARMPGNGFCRDTIEAEEGENIKEIKEQRGANEAKSPKQRGKMESGNAQDVYKENIVFMSSVLTISTP